VLPKHRRWQPRLTRRAVYQNRMTHTLQPACGLVLVFDNDVTCPCVRVVKQLSDRVDGRAGHADGCKRVVPVRGRMLRKCGLDMIEGLFAVRNAIRIRPEPAIIDDSVQSRYGTKLPPQIIIGDSDHDRAIGSLEGLIGAKRLVT